LASEAVIIHISRQYDSPERNHLYDCAGRNAGQFPVGDQRSSTAVIGSRHRGVTSLVVEKLHLIVVVRVLVSFVVADFGFRRLQRDGLQTGPRRAGEARIDSGRHPTLHPIAGRGPDNSRRQVPTRRQVDDVGGQSTSAVPRYIGPVQPVDRGETRRRRAGTEVHQSKHHVQRRIKIRVSSALDCLLSL
jgi:hypothetical protein